MARGRSSRVPDIDEVRSRFEQWRQTRQGKARIPDALWLAAIEMARRDGVNRTAAALHLDGGKLKRRMVAADSASSEAIPPAFVELMAPGTSGLPEYPGATERHWRGPRRPWIPDRDYDESCLAGKDSVWPGGSVIRKWPENGLLTRQNRIGFLARYEDRRKCFAPASMPESLPTINRPYPCRSARSGNMSPGEAGLQPCR